MKSIYRIRKVAPQERKEASKIKNFLTKLCFEEAAQILEEEKSSCCKMFFDYITPEYAIKNKNNKDYLDSLRKKEVEEIGAPIAYLDIFTED